MKTIVLSEVIYMLYPSNYKRKKMSFAKRCSFDFSPVIQERGKTYFLNKNIISCYKNKNEYDATVKGSNHNQYHVSIYVSYNEYNDIESIEYECDCPCEFPCKHIYAVLLAIDHKQYKKPKLKPELQPKQISLKKLIHKIPPKILKKYLLQHIDEHTLELDEETIKKHFIEYLPKETYEFYYNRLYNIYILSKDPTQEIQNNLNQIKEYMSHSDYIQSFMILKAIICSMVDTNHLTDEDFVIDLLLKLRMYLRIITRKADIRLKETMIIPWIKELERHNFYHHIYLEDVFADIKIDK